MRRQTPSSLRTRAPSFTPSLANVPRAFRPHRAGPRAGIALNGAPVPRSSLGRWYSVLSNNGQQTPPNGIFRDFAAFGGGGGIRTPGTHKSTTDFESAAFVHSATPPHRVHMWLVAASQSSARSANPRPAPRKSQVDRRAGAPAMQLSCRAGRPKASRCYSWYAAEHGSELHLSALQACRHADVRRPNGPQGRCYTSLPPRLLQQKIPFSPDLSQKNDAPAQGIRSLWVSASRLGLFLCDP